MLKTIKNFFNKKNTPQTDSQALTVTGTNGGSSTLDIKTREFKKGYHSEAKNIVNASEFQRFAVNLVVDKIQESEYGKHTEFVHEIRYFMHYLFLVLRDDYIYGDKIFLQSLTQVDNYLFSTYRKNQKLKENIQKLTFLANSNRFTENPKENILAYFVFLEENGIEVIDLLQDFCKILGNKAKDSKAILDKKGDKLNKTYEKKTNTNGQNKGLSMKTLHSIAPSLNEKSYSAKLKIKGNFLDKKE